MKIYSYRFLAFGFSLMCLGACTSIPDKNQDPSKNNMAAFRKDWKECREEYPELGSGVNVQQWLGCMNLKGWK